MADRFVIIIDTELSELKRQELKSSFLQLFITEDNLYFYDIWDCFEPHEKQYYECHPSDFNHEIIYQLDTLEKHLQAAFPICDWIISKLGTLRILVGLEDSEEFIEYYPNNSSRW